MPPSQTPQTGGRSQNRVFRCRPQENLEQEIGAPPGPSHLLRLVHSPIDQKVRRTFGDPRSDTQADAVSVGVIDRFCHRSRQQV